MYKRISFSLSALLLAGSVLGQGKADPRTILFSKILADRPDNVDMADSTVIAHQRARALMPRKDARQLTDVFLTLSRDITEEELMEMGVHEPVVIGSVATGYIDISALSELEDNDAITGVTLAGNARLHCDMARLDAGVDAVRTGTPDLPGNYDGTGVIVSLFDQGIEPGHINFLNAGRTENRIKRIWQYETKDNGFGRPVTTETTYITPDEIAGFITDDETTTHGTHTMGIMAGAFGVNKEDPSHDYSGMAPGADILIGCGSLAYSNVIRAIKHFDEYASKENKPLVVNLSFGDNIGPHDGTDAFPKALNALAETVPVFMSAGNEAKTKIALNKTFTDTDKEIKTVIVPRNTIRTYLGASWEAAAEVQVWSEDATPFTVQTGLWDRSEGKWIFLLPLAADGEASYIANGAYETVSNYQNDDFDYLYRDSAIGISTGLDPNNHRYTADIWYLLDKQTNHIDRNIVPALVITGEAGKRIDLYCDGEYNEFDTGRQEGWDAGSADGTISNIACGTNTIAVGSYCTRSLTNSGTEGEVSDFSSWGVMYDGRILPDILAPGECLASSMSTPFTASDFYSEQTYPAVYGMMYGENNPFYWTVLSGTSQSSPAMAGIAALWLQANPDLTPADIKEIATATARPTSEMTPQCGAGKVDALAGLRKAVNYASAIDIPVINSDMLISPDPYKWTIENIRGHEFRVDIFDMSGRQAESVFSSNGTSVEVGESLKGIYIVNIYSGKEKVTRKAYFKK